MAAFTDEPIDPKELMVWLDDHPGAFLTEIKQAFGNTTSKQGRIALGVLMANNRVFPMPHGKGVSWCPGRPPRGRPQVAKMRASWADDKPRTDRGDIRRKQAIHPEIDDGVQNEEEIISLKKREMKYDDERYRKHKSPTRRKDGRVVVDMPRDEY